MRLDRLVTLCIVRPFRQALFKFEDSVGNSRVNGQPSSHEAAIPILMYHSISDDPEPGVAPYYRTNTSPAIFRQQMRYLSDRGYHTITLEKAVKHITTEPKPEHSNANGQPSAAPKGTTGRLVALTFDDGYRDFHSQAFPVLQEFGFTATVFLPTAFIGENRCRFLPAARPASTESREASSYRECLTWKEVTELYEAGIELGSHTVTHPKLTELRWTDIESETANSKAEIERRLGVPVASFAYPCAFPQADPAFVTNFRTILKRAGYHCCATTQLGRVKAGDDVYSLKRLPVNGFDDASLFRAKLEGAYDWVALPQGVVKKIKSRPYPPETIQSTGLRRAKQP